MNLSRRKLLTGFGLVLAAPAIVRVTSLMPVKAWIDFEYQDAFLIVRYIPSTNDYRMSYEEVHRIANRMEDLPFFDVANEPSLVSLSA